jgi:hypothetical protein
MYSEYGMVLALKCMAGSSAYIRVCFPRVMLSALVNRLDAFLEASENKSTETSENKSDAVQTILHWTYPRCVVGDVGAGWTKTGTGSRYDFQDCRIKDVYVDENTRELYITFRGVAYSAAPVLPMDVNDFSVWMIHLVKDEPRMTNPLQIFYNYYETRANPLNFQLSEVGYFPWQDPKKSQETRSRYTIKTHDCKY